MRTIQILALMLTAIGAAPSSALAWGYEGHQIIAHIAASELSPAARSQVSDLLGGDAETEMVAVSTWADEIRPMRRETAPWHFVDIPIRSSGYDAARDCANDDCVVAQIERDQRIVADKSLAAPVRVEALRFLIHFVGDVHQPLHASNNNDRGGNEVRVILGDRRTNLHAVWDTAVVEALGNDPTGVAQRLEVEITPMERSDWDRGTAADWANESFCVAGREIYAKLPGSGGTDAPVILPASYAQIESATAKLQVERAGARLAWVLNAALR